MYNLEYFHCFIPLQLVIQVMTPGEAPKILGSSLEHSRKISQFLTCGPFLACIYIGSVCSSAGADLRHRLQILFSGVPEGGVG